MYHTLVKTSLKFSSIVTSQVLELSKNTHALAKNITKFEPLEQECVLSCNENYQRLGQIRKNCTCTEDQCSLTPDVPSACESVSGTVIIYSFAISRAAFAS